jgi:hypothetical protein
MDIGFNPEFRAASRMFWRRLCVKTETGSSSEMLPISHRRLMLHMAHATVFSHGRSIRIRSTAAIFG